MGRCILIVGLPASGKTTLANSLLKKNCVLVDDPKEGDFDKIGRFLRLGITVIVTDCFLCEKVVQEEAKKSLGSIETEWIFFENDPVQCHINAARRKNKPVDQDIEYWTDVYHIPEGAKVIPVYC